MSSALTRVFYNTLPQNQYPDVDDAELRSMDTRVTELTEQLKLQQANQRELQSSKLSEFLHSMSVVAAGGFVLFCFVLGWTPKLIGV